MGTPIIGRGVRIEVSKTEGAALTVSAITKASPGVASSTAHGLLDGSVGYFTNVVGMSEIDGQPVRLDNKAADTFECEGLNTTNYTTFTSGDFVPISAWATLSRAASYQIGAGDADQMDDTTLLDNIKQNISGLLSAQSVSIGLKHEETDDEALGLVTAAALSGAYLVFRITLKNGAQRIFRAQPGLPGEDVQQGAIGTGSFSANVKRLIQRLA